jgi:hypothetical protein
VYRAVYLVCVCGCVRLTVLYVSICMLEIEQTLQFLVLVVICHHLMSKSIH